MHTAKQRSVLFLVSSMNTGGAERVASLLCNEWASEGHDVTLMPTFSARGNCDYSLAAGVKLEYLGDLVRLSGFGLLDRIRRLLALRQYVAQRNPDCVVSFLTHVNVAALLATYGQAVRVVVSERTYPPAVKTSRVLSWFRKWLYPRANAVVMQTEDGARWLDAVCPAARGVTIGNPVQYPLPDSAPALLPDDVLDCTRHVVLGVGRLRAEKGFSTLVAAFAGLAEAHPDWDLVILGDGDERAALEGMCRSGELAGRVFLPGQAGNLGAWYERAQVFALTSKFEGFPNALLEAMAYGTPPVSMDCNTGPRRILRDGVDGVLVDPAGGASAFCDALESLIANPALRQQMGDEATFVRRRFAVSGIAQRWTDVLWGDAKC